MRKKLLAVILGGGLAFAMAIVGGIGSIGGAGQASVRPAHQVQAMVMHPDDTPIIKG